MTTMVFNPSGTLQQLQVGAADIVALCAAAQSAWGWVGGLNGLKSMLNQARRFVGLSPSGNSLLSAIKLPAPAYNILTARGLVTLEDHNGQEAFGGDPTMQCVGVTLCALAHECPKPIAVKLFMQFMAPSLFSEECTSIHGLKEAIQMQLMDNIDVILNEGAIHGLTQRFLRVGEGLPVGDRDWLKRYARMAPDSGMVHNEYALVGGMLQWVGKQEARPYFTRSGLVARISAYLREVGYPLDQAHIWNGNDPRPWVVRAVILVTGGTSETDPLQMGSWNLDVDERTSHYQLSTVGATIINSVRHDTDISPETAQHYFRNARDIITKLAKFVWRAGITDIEVILEKSHPDIKPNAMPRPSPFAMALASIYFPRSANIVAWCYEVIANEAVRSCVVQEKDAMAKFQDLAPELVEFRVVTSAIVFAIVGEIAGNDYWSITHATLIDLSCGLWLNSMCSAIDKGLSTSLTLQEASMLVASIHTAAVPGNIENAERIVGSRNGAYAVVPALLMHMTPEPECIGLECVDRFIANLPVHSTAIHPSGFVVAGNTPWINFFSHEEERQSTPFDISTRRIGINESYVGPAVAGPPDVALYLAVERLHDVSEPEIILAGRVNGEVIGCVSILDVMWTVARSLQVAAKCPGKCQTGQPALNVTASQWAGQRGPVTHPRFPVCLQVAGDPTWKLFAAGQVHQRFGMLWFGCLTCAIKEIEDRGVGDNSGGRGSIVISS